MTGETKDKMRSRSANCFLKKYIPAGLFLLAALLCFIGTEIKAGQILLEIPLEKNDIFLTVCFERGSGPQAQMLEELSRESGARFWAYGRVETVTLEQGLRREQMNAVCYEGSLFAIHPWLLRDGSYPADEALLPGVAALEKTVLFNDAAAFSLFGAENVTGMKVWQGGKAYPAAGVIKLPRDRAGVLAGTEEPVTFMPFFLPEERAAETGGGQSAGEKMDFWELILPVETAGDGGALFLQSLPWKTDCYTAGCMQTRFTFDAGLKRLRQAGAERMKKQAVILPFWENRLLAEEAYIDAGRIVASICLLAAGVAYFLARLPSGFVMQDTSRNNGHDFSDVHQPDFSEQ